MAARISSQCTISDTSVTIMSLSYLKQILSKQCPPPEYLYKVQTARTNNDSDVVILDLNYHSYSLVHDS